MGVSREEGAGRTTRKRGEGAWSKSWATNRGTQQQQKQQQYEDGSLSSYRRPDCKGIGQRIGGEEKKNWGRSVQSEVAGSGESLAKEKQGDFRCGSGRKTTGTALDCRQVAHIL